MMAVPDIAELQSRMRPGAFSRLGFLGSDEGLEEVLEADRREVCRLGLTFERLADALERLIDAAVDSRGRSAIVDGKFRVKTEVFTGFQICPFASDPHHAQCGEAGGVRHGSINWKIKNAQTGQTMTGPGLIVHLMRAHHFCEGRQAPMRVDPCELARLLELA